MWEEGGGQGTPGHQTGLTPEALGRAGGRRRARSDSGLLEGALCSFRHEGSGVGSDLPPLCSWGASVSVWVFVCFIDKSL